MKLDVKVLRYMSREEFRTLVAVEMGMKNHDVVPVQLIATLAGLRHGGIHKHLSALLRNKLIGHDRRTYDGYRLTYLGYDYLALRTFVKRGLVAAVGTRIGVGKESDIFVVQNDDGQELALKLHRLGRVSFRNIKAKRDYLVNRQSASWLYMSRLAAMKEFAFMKALYEHGFPTPVPVEHNRHCVLMSLVRGYPLYQVRQLAHPEAVYRQLMAMLLRLAQRGLIHCDFNEFNLMVDDHETITLIDFPQMVSTLHENARMYFERDVNGVRLFFAKMFALESDDYPRFEDVVREGEALDEAVRASGFSTKEETELERLQRLLADTDEAEAEAAAAAAAEEAAEEDEEDEEDEEEGLEAGAEDATLAPTAAVTHAHGTVHDDDAGKLRRGGALDSSDSESAGGSGGDGGSGSDSDSGAGDGAAAGAIVADSAADDAAPGAAAAADAAAADDGRKQRKGTRSRVDVDYVRERVKKKMEAQSKRRAKATRNRLKTRDRRRNDAAVREFTS